MGFSTEQRGRRVGGPGSGGRINFQFELFVCDIYSSKFASLNLQPEELDVVRYFSFSSVRKCFLEVDHAVG